MTYSREDHSRYFSEDEEDRIRIHSLRLDVYMKEK